MKVMGSGRTPPIEWVYIDGGYLRKRLENYGQLYDGKPIELDYGAFFHRFEKKFYYDCLPPQADDESNESFEVRTAKMRKFFDSLSELPGFHVYEGKLSGSKEKARQKGVDVQLAVHMLTHARQGTVRNITLVAGDADFVPLLEAVGAEGAYVRLLFDRQSVAQRLIHAADISEPLLISNVFNSTTAGFQKCVSIPRTTNSNEKQPGDMSLIKTGKLAEGGVAELYEKGGQFLLIYPDSHLFMNIGWTSEKGVVAIAKNFGKSIEWI